MLTLSDLRKLLGTRIDDADEDLAGDRDAEVSFSRDIAAPAPGEPAAAVPSAAPGPAPMPGGVATRGEAWPSPWVPRRSVAI
jgi:hypothetical protein